MRTRVPRIASATRDILTRTQLAIAGMNIVRLHQKLDMYVAIYLPNLPH